MTQPGPHLDPSAVALLQQVARDPQSSLLNVAQPEWLAEEAAEGSETLLRALGDMSRAEWELASVYRDEVAHLLGVACFERSQKLALKNGSRYIQPLARERQTEIGDAESARRLQLIQDEWEVETDPGPESALGAIQDLQTTPLELAALSLRFAPSFAPRTYVIDAALEADNMASAQHHCRSLLQTALSAEQRAQVLERLMIAEARLGLWNEALATARRAARCDPRSVSAAVNQLYHAICWGNLETARTAARHFDECTTQRPGVAQTHLQHIAEQSHATGWQPPRQVTHRAKRVLQSCGAEGGPPLMALFLLS